MRPTIRPQGLHHPDQLRKSWYFFFFALPDLPEAVLHANNWHFFRHFLHDANPAYTPEEIDRYVEAWSQLDAATGMINYRSSVRQSQKRPRRLFARSRPPRWSSGGSAIITSAPSSPNPTTTTSPTSTASSACPTPRTKSVHHDEHDRVTQLLIDFFAPARTRGDG